VSYYGLDDRLFGVRSPAGAKDFSSSLCVQTGSGAHPASCTMDTGDKARPGRDADHSPASSDEVVNEWELYLLFPQAPPWRVAGLLYFLLYYNFRCLLISVFTRGEIECTCDQNFHKSRQIIQPIQYKRTATSP
jgi:hypothetical protein